MYIREVALLFVRAGLLVASAGDALVAQVQLPVVNLGDTNFEDGLGGPGWLFEAFPTGYVAGEMKDASGKTVVGSNRLTTYSATAHIAFVSHKRFLGGWLLGEALLPVVDLDLELASRDGGGVRGFGDPEFGSGLQWAPRAMGKGIFAQRVVVDAGVPAGKYIDARAVNSGNHFVVINPFYAFTYEPNKKLEFSARVHYLWNSTNYEPYVNMGIRDTQAGQALHANYAMSYELVKNVRLGFNGYWLQQLTDHRINGVSVANSKERTVGLGPGLQLTGRGLWFRVNSYIETGVRNRPSGIKLTMRISRVLAAEAHHP